MGSMAPIIPGITSSIHWNRFHNHYDAVVSVASAFSGFDKPGIGMGESLEDAFGEALADFCKQNGIKHGDM